jgi:predicted RNA-binding protein with PUA-like domain
MAKRYWLLKTEPGCFSIDDLKKLPNGTEHWDGVRNYQARNMLRDDIKKGDEAFFYHSKSKPMGIAGICSITRSGYPDFTAENPEEQHFDPKHTADNPIWYMVDVKFKRKFKEVITLEQLKKTPGLEKMVLTQRGSRLSVQPVTPAEWAIIMKLADR